MFSCLTVCGWIMAIVWFTSYNATVSSTVGGKQFMLSSVVPASPLVGISGSQTVTGNYGDQRWVTFVQVGLDGSTASGTVLTVNGTGVSFVQLPYSVWVNSGDSSGLLL